MISLETIMLTEIQKRVDYIGHYKLTGIDKEEQSIRDIKWIRRMSQKLDESNYYLATYFKKLNALY